MSFQPSLFRDEQVSFDRSFSALQRSDLDERSWVDFQPGWVAGSDALFREIIDERQWKQRTRRLFDKEMLEPRLSSPWTARSGDSLRPAIVDDLRLALSRRYGVPFASVGFNWYRDGQDSVAWHGDRIRREFSTPARAFRRRFATG